MICVGMLWDNKLMNLSLDSEEDEELLPHGVVDLREDVLAFCFIMVA